MIDYLIDLNKETNIPLMELVRISETVKQFTKNETIIKQYMTNTYSGCIYEAKDEIKTNYTRN